MPEIRMSDPFITLGFSEVSQRTAIKIRKQLSNNLKAQGLEVIVAYSEVDHAIRVTIRPTDKSVFECLDIIHSTLIAWNDSAKIASSKTKQGRRITW